MNEKIHYNYLKMNIKINLASWLSVDALIMMTTGY